MCVFGFKIASQTCAEVDLISTYIMYVLLSIQYDSNIIKDDYSQVFIEM